jgi:4-alpha-glucanotransferase
VAELKLPLLEALFAQFQASATPERRAAFAAFREELGEPLERFCLFQALRERFAAEDPPQPAWQNWPEPFRDGPDAPEVVRFRERHQERVDFFAWLQWVADAQLAAAARGGDGNGGLAIGICRDLAVGADAAGAETWANRGVVVPGAAVGAPPDIFNPAGQNWGLPPFAPAALRAEGYRSFVGMVRANMRHAGALRIDHILGLQHFFWIPQGWSAGEGAYVAYPLEDLLGILALESHRHRCLVVGEDLGTVPKLLRERMPDYGLLGYRVVFFEWTDDGRFKAPEAYDQLAFSTIASHDLATLRGWWEGRDIDAKAERGLYPGPDEEASQRERRSADRGRFVDALRAARLSLRPSFGPDWPWSDSLGVAAHAFLARTRSAVAMVQLDDLTGEPDQVNLPGTTDEYPNWRRKLSMTLEELARDERACALMSLLAAARTTTG